ncbi:MAG: 4-hydroxy-tetrahydrodipicolinate reductase [Bacteroidota bacterium]
MKIALIGYGKMGKSIDRLAIASGDEIVLTVNSSNKDSYTDEELRKADVAIEFTRPDQAVDNLRRCISAGVPVVTGTTGWYDKLPVIKKECESGGGSVFYASNFSIGVHLFFEAARHIALLMSNHPQYANLSVHETHHIHKADAPSGTAIKLAEKLLSVNDHLKKWTGLPEGADRPTSDTLPVYYTRSDEVPGTHTAKWESVQDCIHLTHTAHNRDGFASGALTAARWLLERKAGVFTMEDLLVL